jgi:spermidine synthase
MRRILLITILVIGLSGMVAQGLILRELLAAFYGNELILGIMLANWVILEALGAFISGRLIERARDKINIFLLLNVIFLLSLPFSVYLARSFKGALGIPIGQAVSLPLISISSFLIILPLSFSHGALFSAGCKIHFLYARDSQNSIAKVYAQEIIGTVIGALILNYLFIPYLMTFQAACSISFINLITCLIIVPASRAKLKYAFLAGAFILAYLFYSGALGRIERISINKQFPGRKILDYRSSVYANIAVSGESGQYTFFYNGLPIITVPCPDTVFAEEFAAVPLLFHGAADNLLIINAGVGGLIHQALKYPVKNIDYAQIDPLIIAMLKKYPTPLTAQELGDERVNIINTDGRYFLRKTDKRYDVILLGLAAPSDLSANRFFTKEFFSLARARLKPDGIFAFWLPGSSTYLSRELADLNSCLLNGLKQSFDYLRIIPGEYNIFLASSSKEITRVSSALITQRMSAQNIETKFISPKYLEFKLDQGRLDWFKQSLQGSTAEVNLDFKPFAVFAMLKFWNKKFSHFTLGALSLLQGLGLGHVSILIFLIMLICLCLWRHCSWNNLPVVYSIATTGFFAMLFNLILIFAFQTLFGYLYYRIGLLISIFMAGVGIGSLWVSGKIKDLRQGLRLLAGFELLIIVFAYFAALLITKFIRTQNNTGLIFGGLFLASGLIVGAVFPLAARIYRGRQGALGEVSAALYTGDLAASALAGIFGAVVFLPVLGIFKSCLIIIILKLSSLVVLAAKTFDTSGGFR